VTYNPISPVSDLPPFTLDGVLPLGDYALTLRELRASRLVGGARPTASWDHVWRSKLVDHVEVLVGELWQCGVERIFLSGSFVERKDHPIDLDGYFECDEEDFLSGNLERRLNAINPDKIWTWDPDRKRLLGDAPRAQLPIWHRHRVDLWPHYGQVGGETDSYGYDMLFPSLFRRTKYPGRRKGIVKLVRQS
jgi:hypothetical protein